MYITAAALSMDASQTYKEVEQRFSGLTSTSGALTGQSDGFGIHLASMLTSSQQTTINCHSEICQTEGTAPASEESGVSSQPETVVLKQMTEHLTGQSVRIQALQSSLTSNTVLEALQGTPFMPTEQSTLFFTSGRVYSEASSLLFSAQGNVQTEDGREISFDMGLSLQQDTVAVTTSSFATDVLFIDPLVLQFDLDSPLLSDTSFLFDIDCDGELEDLASPGSGCGFLAFDQNGDGTINDGSELFGPESGSGFGELAELDSDANLWIDENDPIFNQLSIWSRDETGAEQLLSLKEAGVGAIALTHAGTGYQLRREDGSVSGVIGAEGIFLTEEGEVRPMQEVELALDTKETSSQADEGIDAFWAEAEQNHTALQSLRDIIGMQRLRLKMMLTGKNLQGLTEANSQQQRFFDWLQQQTQWHQDLDARLEASQEQDTNSLLT
nr:hypothetical protein [uncultured Desulfobulbus sp.]